MSGTPPHPTKSTYYWVVTTNLSADLAGKEVGMWIWDTPLNMSATYQAQILNTLQENGFNTVYLTIDDYLDISALSSGSEKDIKQAAYFSALNAFIRLENQHHIIVDVEGGAKDWTPPVLYNGETSHMNTQLLALLARKPGSEMIVMAYRNFFFGSNGTEEASKPDILEASAGKYPIKIIVAQETGNVQPDYVTFHGLSKSDLFSALNSVAQTYASYTSFGGVAVDYIDPFLQLK